MRMHLRRLATVLALCALGAFDAAHISSSQASPLLQASDPASFEFEVASIKPSNPSTHDRTFIDVPGTDPVETVFSARNAPLIDLIRLAYGVPMKGANQRISGAPGWLESEKYDIDAKFDDDTIAALNKLSGQDRKAAVQKMILKLLAQRLNYSAHTETKELPVYTLVITKNGSKLKEASATDSGAAKTGSLKTKGRGSIEAQAMPMANLVIALSVLTQRTVIDKTGLTGKYTFELHWSTDDSLITYTQKHADSSPAGSGTAESESNYPPLFVALQQQLGLKLESGKGPVQIIVIDHIERPSAN